jgi:endonuclease/exonuclease/phosphatase (EEP) superfamily protein YafD
MTATPRKWTFKRFVRIALCGYALALIGYLILRWIFKPDWSLVLLSHTVAFYLFLPVLVGLLIAMLIRAPRLIGIYWVLIFMGLVWFVPRLMPPLSSPQQNGTALKLISFNVFPYNQQLDDVTEWLLSENADIIALQEIGTELPALTDDYPYHISQGFVNGHTLFSRYPIVISETVQLLDTPQQRLVLDVAGQNIVLYNLHLYMPLNDNASQFLLLRYDETRRNQQINELLTFIAGETQPVIIVGDFNLSEFSPIYNRLDAQFQDAYRNASWGLGQTFPSGASEELDDIFPPLFRLDYVWYTDGLQALNARVGSRLGSDHLPLIITLDVLP